jgi:hypothetical protein
VVTKSRRSDRQTPWGGGHPLYPSRVCDKSAFGQTPPLVMPAIPSYLPCNMAFGQERLKIRLPFYRPFHLPWLPTSAPVQINAAPSWSRIMRKCLIIYPYRPFYRPFHLPWLPTSAPIQINAAPSWSRIIRKYLIIYPYLPFYLPG